MRNAYKILVGKSEGHLGCLGGYAEIILKWSLQRVLNTEWLFTVYTI
jgi:hypothetical protein